jgi:DHA2 family multidrug resistance protein
MHVRSMTSQARSRGKWWTAAAILPGQLTIAFGMFGVVVALPNLITAFGTDVQTVQWVMTAYLVARVVPMPAMGWLVSQLGQRNVYVLGVLGTTVTTVLCGLSWSIESLIACRALQGMVGAAVMSSGMVMLYEAFPAAQRGLAMGLFIMVASLGPTLGQSVGGYLVQEISWRAIFFLAVPSGILGTILPCTRMPRDLPTTAKSLDVPGLCTMTIGLITLLLALTQGQQYGWDSRYLLVLYAVSGLCLVLFIATELRVAHPVVPLRLYRNLPFVLASMVVFLYNAGFMGANVLVALMVQLVFDFTPWQAGVILAPGALVMGVIGLIAGRLSDHLAPHRLVCAGLVLFACDMYGFAVLSQTVSISTMSLLVILQRGAFGMIFSASDTAIMRTLPAADRSVGSGLHNMHRGIAMAFGVALCSVLLEQRLALHQLQYANAHDSFDLPVRHALAAFQELLFRAGEGPEGTPGQALAALANLLTEHARLAAYQDCFLLIGLGFLLSLAPAWWARMRPPHPRTRRPSPHAKPAQGKATVAR